MSYQFNPLPLEGLVLVEFESGADSRGSFSELYRQAEYKKQGIPDFVQDNFSVSQKGVLRGMHYQTPPKAQGKLVFVLEGEIFDVVVDIREKSQTFKQWHAENLKADSNKALYVPPGFAHGFLVLSNTARVLYKVTSEYAPELEKGIVWNDPELNINWPISSPTLKPRDAGFPTIAQAEIL